MKFKSYQTVFCVVSAFVASSAVINTVSANTANGITLQNGAVLHANASLALGNEQNVALTEADEIDSNFWQLDIATSLLLDPGFSTHEFTIEAKKRDYVDSAPDSYMDSLLAYQGEWEPTSRLRAKWALASENSHQQRGTGLDKYRLESVTEVLEFTNNTAHAEIEYGGTNAIGRIGVRLKTQSLEFTNLPIITETSSYDAPGVDTWFYYNIGAVTRLTFDIKYQDYQYDVPSSILRDSNVARFLVGAEWEGLAKTTGRFKLGVENRDFADAQREDFTGLTTDIGVTWSPRSYSIVDMLLSRRTNEAGFDSDFRLTTSFNASWRHAWSDIVSTVLQYQYMQEQEKGGLERKDTRQYLFVGATRQMAQQISIEAGLKLLTNSSSQLLFDYDNQQLLLNLKYAL